MHAFSRSIRNVPSQFPSRVTTRSFIATLQKSKYQPPQSRSLENATTTLKGQPLDRSILDAMLRRRMFYTPSFGSYKHGVSGLFDYGPPGCALQANVIDVWRKHFVLEEDMLELDCTVLTPAEVLETSGHVERFVDWMCKDPTNGDVIRADHFVRDSLEARLRGDRKTRGLEVEREAGDKKSWAENVEAMILSDEVVKEYEEVLAKLDNYNGEELGQLIKGYKLKNPTTGVEPSEPVAFNLMFRTSIGSSSNVPGYLRPETAQGQFLNFAKLLDFNQQRMPFASASIGKSFRNEISPRAGLLRVREFLMAEVEHYVDPEGGKKHERFEEVKDVELVLLDRHTQLAGQTNFQKISIGKAVADGTVDNETLGYFLARINLFLEKIGIDKSKIRFRQHMANEMAHYATDCWDAELLTSYGWIECVGCADRSAYDLTVHAKKTGAPSKIRERLSKPLTTVEWEIKSNNMTFGPHFKRNREAVQAALEAIPQSHRESLAASLESNGKITVDVDGLGLVEIGRDLVTIDKRTRVQSIREYTPNVIEPSFGIGRILYALLEHTYWERNGDDSDGRSVSGIPSSNITMPTIQVLSFPPIIAPTKVVILPLSSQESFKSLLKQISQKLRLMGISNRIDGSSTTIGKRYSRNDELGTPLGITIDFQSFNDGTFTLRDRDSTRQVRGGEEKILAAIKGMVEGTKVWADIEKELPLFESQIRDPPVG
ncbi:hypothetical protein B7494_g3389 [Chlorociboria aeruginascens]|nr:hypothetical protein B7494_g3389 [Chlorociboria aeruginascens]